MVSVISEPCWAPTCEFCLYITLWMSSSSVVKLESDFLLSKRSFSGIFSISVDYRSVKLISDRDL